MTKPGILGLPSGELSHSYGKSPFWMGKSTISMAIFNSYVKLPEGTTTTIEMRNLFSSLYTYIYVCNSIQFRAGLEGGKLWGRLILVRMSQISWRSKPELLMGYYKYWLLKQFCEAAVCGWHSLLPVKVLQSWYFQMWEWQDATWHRLNSTELKHSWGEPPTARWRVVQ